MTLKVDEKVLYEVLNRYGFTGKILQITPYFNVADTEKGRMKVIYGVNLDDGRKLVIKLLNEPDESRSNRENVEKQSVFSENLRRCGIDTPKRYLAEGAYCTETVVQGILCTTTVEDWCGEEIKTIDSETAYKIGALMARMHQLSLRNGWKLGAKTLFSAAYDNDVDAYPQFRALLEANQLDGDTAEALCALRQEKLERIRKVWDMLPKCAVQGDISVNNLVLSEGELRVFDYNNAGDEVCVGDLIMEGLLTAFEMDLPEGVPQSSREQLFIDFVNGYTSVRPLTPAEQDVAWDIYTLYHSLWFTRIVYNEDSLEQLLKCGAVEEANAKLRAMLEDMQQPNTGLFSN